MLKVQTEQSIACQVLRSKSPMVAQDGVAVGAVVLVDTRSQLGHQQWHVQDTRHHCW
jgi:hypothetical protein